MRMPMTDEPIRHPELCRPPGDRRARAPTLLFAYLLSAVITFSVLAAMFIVSPRCAPAGPHGPTIGGVVKIAGC